MDDSHKAQVPFGYQIIDSPEQRPELDAPRPEDQLRLLSPQEEQVLDSFFANMANDPHLDPSLLMEGGVQGDDAQNAFPQFSGDFEFQSSMPQPFQTSSTRSSDAKPQVSASPGSASTLSYGVGPQNQPVMSSQHGREAADVFSAAQHLTGMGYAGHQGPPTPTHYVQANMTSRPQYPPISQTFTNQPYQTSNGQHSRSNSGYTNTTPLTHTPTFEQSRANQKRPVGLAFGSDDKFQPTEYKSPDDPSGYQDDIHQLNLLNSAVAEGPHDPRMSHHHQYGGNTSPGSGHGGGHHSSASYDGDDDHPDHPRKRSRRDADLDDGAGAPSSSRRKSNADTGRRGQKQVASPSRRKSSAVAGVASPRDSENGGTASKSARQNLSEDQKRENHIQSEQKRRNLIKEGFDEAKQMVPELRNVNPTKGNFLQAAARFMRDLKERNAAMEQLIKELELDKG